MDKRGYICFVWDDGFKTDKTVAMKMQLDRGLKPKGTSFIVGYHVVNNEPARLNIEECREMLDYGWDFQDHSYSHPVITSDFVDLTGDEMRADLQQMNDLFENKLHIPKPEHWSIPGGTLNEKVLNVVGRERKTIMVGGSRFITPYSNALMLPSFDISPKYKYIDYLDESGDRKQTIRKVIDDVVKYGYGAVLYCHEMSDSAEIEAYKDALDYSIASGAQLVTLTEMYNIFRWRGYNFPMK